MMSTVQITITGADAALLSEAFDYSQFSDLNTAENVKKALRRLLTAVQEADPATPARHAEWARSYAAPKPWGARA